MKEKTPFQAEQGSDPMMLGDGVVLYLVSGTKKVGRNRIPGALGTLAHKSGRQV